MGFRDVNGVAILEWPSGGKAPSVATDVRSLIEAERTLMLVDMRGCAPTNEHPLLGGDALEALTEAHRVCSERNGKIGLFGLSFAMKQLLEMLDIVDDVPPVLGETEDEAVGAINGRAPTAALEFEIDLGTPVGGPVTGAKAMAPTARFEPTMAAAALAPPGSAPTARFDPQALRADEPESDGAGLLTVHWGDLASKGYVLGGEGAEEIMAAISAAPEPQPAEAEAGVIDLGGVVPATVSKADQPTFDFGAPAETGWSASPTGAVEIDFGSGGAAALGGGLDAAPSGGLFGGGVEAFSGSVFGSEGGDFSPMDAGGGAPPASVLQPTAEAGAFGGDGGGFGQDAAFSDGEDSDETIMFQPGALDQALLQASLAAAAEAASAPAEQEPEAAPAPAAVPAPVTPAPVEAPMAMSGGFGLENDNETVMIQPGMLDAALLAQVAAAAGAEGEVPTPAIDTPPPAPVPASMSGEGLREMKSSSQPKPNLDGPAFSMPNGAEVELRLFLHDCAITSDAHLHVLERMVKGSEKVFGPSDFEGDAVNLLDQFTQSRLVRRTRSPRVRGGTGFVFSTSPSKRKTVVRLLRMWSHPHGRVQLQSWLQGA